MRTNLFILVTLCMGYYPLKAQHFLNLTGGYSFARIRSLSGGVVSPIEGLNIGAGYTFQRKRFAVDIGFAYNEWDGYKSYDRSGNINIQYNTSVLSFDRTSSKSIGILATGNIFLIPKFLFLKVGYMKCLVKDINYHLNAVVIPNSGTTSSFSEDYRSDWGSGSGFIIGSGGKINLHHKLHLKLSLDYSFITTQSKGTLSTNNSSETTIREKQYGVININLGFSYKLH